MVDSEFSRPRTARLAALIADRRLANDTAIACAADRRSARRYAPSRTR